MSRIRTVVVASAMSLFAAAIVTGAVVALAANTPTAVRTASTSSGASTSGSSQPVAIAAGNSTPQDHPSVDEQSAPATPGASDGDGGTGGADPGASAPDGGGTIPPLPPVPIPEMGVAAEITWLGATPYPATCGGSFTIFADVWDDVGVVSATAYMEGVSYAMFTNTGVNWYVVVPVPAGAELIGGVSFSVDIRDGDGMGMWSSSQVNVTC